ncbi:MAG: PAS domain-containing protein [Candidatus Hadarchaeota archaeon]
MDVNTLAINLFGVVNVILAIILVYYTLRNVHVLRGAHAQYPIAVGVILFVVVSIYFPVQHYLSNQIVGARLLPFSVFLLGAASVFIGMAHSGMTVRKATGGLPWPELLRKFRYGVLRLAGISIVLAVVLPLWALSFWFEIQPEIFVVIVQLSFAAFFIAFITSEMMLYRSTRPSAVSAGAADEELLRADLRLLRAYSDLTSRFSATAATVTGVGLMRDALAQAAGEHEILRGCEFTERGFLKTEKALKALAEMNEKRSLSSIPPAFSGLNSRLIELYGAITSSEFAKRVFSNIYREVKDGYKSVKDFPEVVRGLPTGVLEDEKIAFARREELERMVRERTAQLEKTVAELERAEAGLHDSERRFKGLMGLLPEPVFETDETGRLAFFNLAGYNTFGYFPKDLEEGLELTQLLAPSDRERARKDMEKARIEKSVVSGEYTAVKKDGGKFAALMRLTPIVHAGQTVGMRGVFVDITDRKRLDEIERRGLLDALKRLQLAGKVERRGMVPEKLQRIQAESIDIIKRHMATARPSAIVETYRELLGKGVKARKKAARPKGKRRKKTRKASKT